MIPSQTPLHVQFFRDAQNVYGAMGLIPSTPGSVGIDLRACLPEGEQIAIGPGQREQIPVGIAIEPLQPGIAGFVYSRSGLGAVKGLVVAQGVGIIDPDYRGEISVIMLNTGQQAQTITCGDRIAQIVFQAYLVPRFHIVEELSATSRGEGGFGHTGQQ